MNSTTAEKKTLAELMSDGWSWGGCVSSHESGSGSNIDYMVDETTGKKYKLHVRDGKLVMTEVPE